MSGFNVNELLHRSCSCAFMHGELTNHATVNRLQEALQNQLDDQMEILLYKKNSNAAVTFVQFYYHLLCCVGLQCIDAVGWAAGRASGL